jgi:pimeloyl-ACP methyl ester carboxylesterase
MQAMRICRFTMFLFGTMLCTAAEAADLAGTWQTDGKPQRVLKISKVANGYRGDFYNLGVEQPLSPRHETVSAITVSGNSIHFAPDKAQGKFDGTLSEDGKTLTGTWKMLYGPASQPLTFTRTAKKDEWVTDASPHKVTFITVQPGVKLEVLDWGGNGPPLLFLGGGYSTGHAFDGFAEKFTAKYHVYAVTRRGFGLSSLPPLTDENYDADRLGDDVLAVMDAMHIQKPVIAGHSMAGGELSSIGTRHPERVAGLIYLDALFSYSFDDPTIPDIGVDGATVRRNMGRLLDLQPSTIQWRALIKETQAAMRNLDQSLKDMYARGTFMEKPLDEQSPSDFAANKISINERRYGVAPVPILAIVALSKYCPPGCDSPDIERIMANAVARADHFEKAAPNARVVRIPGASHYIWRSNEAEVQQEMNTFMDGLAH